MDENTKESKLSLFIKRHKKNHDEHIKKCQGLNINKEEFAIIKKKIIIFRIITMIIGLFIVTSVFHVAGFATIAICIAIMLLLTELVNTLMYMSIEKKILSPIEDLRSMVLKISDGDYSVRVQNNVLNEIGTLIDEFNSMAQKLEDSENIQIEYENNRKNIIANISHDLKTPITSINGYVDLIIDGEISDKEKLSKYLDVISSNCNYMNKLIDDLFLFSKLDMQKVDFEFTDINISNYIEDIMGEFKFTFEEDSLTFNYYDEIKNDILVNIDAKQLYRTIRNIVGNAKKYGTDNLNVKVRLYNDTGNIFLSIKDNGHGIPEADIQNIFNRFYRVDKERTKNIMSTGLGLAISKEIVEAHNGEIFVESDIGFGSTFTIKLPISK
ncbi:cell wall metabolism sensor histidine kinase WalK [uncultured Clostridium sp.]|uniref:sensor histidine kinase n=1 Tax=uncultured Clostridium sp. TaxID=59620 RepID=UPI002635C568|nr:HAMP domain-containing sensor histidine kinase [uncultured Clostridium sp.]